jgi:glycosyltransferase involved in cell wall biosynthesis
MLPFEKKEARRFGFGFFLLKFEILKRVQLNTFNKSKGVIFLSDYAKKVIYNQTHSIKKSIIIPHGINKIFYKSPIPQKLIFTKNDPCKLIYVSKTDPYKHHINLVKALKILLDKSFPVELVLIGPEGTSHSKLMKVISEVNSYYDSISYLGPISYETLNKFYNESDICIFASSCENLPNILLESMASGLPVATSNMGPMPEIIKENAEYFNPESIQEIATALEKLIRSPSLRNDLALKSYNSALSYSWSKCADETFNFFNEIIQDDI